MPCHSAQILMPRRKPWALHRKPKAVGLGWYVVASQAVNQNASKAASICLPIYTDVRMLGNLSQECQRVPQFALRVYRTSTSGTQADDVRLSHSTRGRGEVVRLKPDLRGGWNAPAADFDTFATKNRGEKWYVFTINKEITYSRIVVCCNRID